MLKRFLSLTLLLPLLLAFDGLGQTAYLINEGFESATFPPTGWTNNGAIQSANNPRSGTKTLAFNAVDDAIYTPVLSKPGQLSFWYRRSSNTTAWTLNVQVSTNASNWSSIGTITNASATYQEFTYNLSSYSNIYIRLIDQRGSGTHERYVDDFTVTTQEPTTNVTSPVFSNVTPTGLTLSWTNGNGDGRLVLIKQGSVVNASPVDGTDYTANAAFGSGTQVGTGNYVVFKGSGNSVDITGLTAGAIYYISVFEYNGLVTSPNFLTTSPATGSQTTFATEPTTSASSLSFSPVTTTGMTINWTNGNGAGRTVFVKEGSGSITDPTDGTSYTASADWSSKGTQLGTSGYYCVYDGTGSSVALTNLSPSTSYYVYVYEYNGSNTSTNYKTTSPLTGNQATLTPGSDPNVAFTGTDPGSAQFITGSTKNVIYRALVTVTGSDVTMTEAGFTTSGNYTASDISGGGFKLFYSADATLDLSDTEIGSLSSTSNGSSGDIQLFTGLSQNFAVGTAYLFLTVDVDAGATSLRTISVDQPISADFTFAVTVTNTGSSFATGSVHSFYYTPPALTADNTSNNVDNDIDITFTDNSTWRGAITAVKIGGTALTLTTDYVISSGMIKLKPSGGNSLLQSAGSKSVTVEATGFITASVTQQINVGAPTTNSTAAISSALTLNSTRTVTVTANDQYGNTVSGYTFKYDVTVTNANPTTAESYTIDGTSRASSVTDVSFNAVTNASGVATFDITVPATVDANDGVSVQVQLMDGVTNIGSAFNYTNLPPSVLTAGDIAILAAQSASPEYVSFILLTTVNPLTEILITDNGWVSSGSWRTGEGILKWTSPSQQLPVGTIINITTGTPSVNIGTISVVSGSFSIASTDQVLIYQGASTFITAININGAWSSATTSNTSAIPAGLTNGVNCLYILDQNGYYSSSLSGSVTSNRSKINNANSWTLSASSQSVPYFGNINTITISSVSQTSNNLSSNVLSNITFTGLSTTGSLVITQYYTPPTGTTGITQSNVGSYRWVIENSGVSFTGATFRFDIFRLPGNGGILENASDIKLYKRPSEGSGSWTLVGTLTYNNNSTAGVLTDDYLTISGITSFSEFVMASEGSPLPVELTSFTASAKGSSVTLNWETKTEVDNNGFEVERNSTGTWQKIGFVEGHGTANSPKYYSFNDNNPLGNKIQYRLKQIDNDGTFEYSPVVEVELNPTQFTVYQNYPNPFNPSTVIRFALPVAGNVTVNVFNTLGEKVATLLDGPMEAGYQQVTFDAANFPSGLYFYEISAGEFKSIKKMLLMK